jgi:hypothetical protein
MLEVMYVYVRGIEFASFYDFDILFWNYFESAVFFYMSFNKGCGVILDVWTQTITLN